MRCSKCGFEPMSKEEIVKILDNIPFGECNLIALGIRQLGKIGHYGKDIIAEALVNAQKGVKK